MRKIPDSAFPLPPVLICSPYQSIKLQLGKQKPLQVSKYEGFSSKELEVCVIIRRSGHMRQENCWMLLDDLVMFSRLSSLLCTLVPRFACICSLLLLHSLDGCLFLADLTQDYTDLREGNIFPCSSPVIAENIERDGGMLIPDHQTHNSRDISSSPGLMNRK